jgi:hypothetical protein
METIKPTGLTCYRKFTENGREAWYFYGSNGSRLDAKQTLRYGSDCWNN